MLQFPNIYCEVTEQNWSRTEVFMQVPTCGVSFAELKILGQRWLIQFCRLYWSSHVTIIRQFHSTLNGEACLLPLWAFNHSNYSAFPILTAGMHCSPLLRLAWEVDFFFLSQVNDHSTKHSPNNTQQFAQLERLLISHSRCLMQYPL